MTAFQGAVDAAFAAFGIDGVYTPAGGEPVQVRVIARRPDTIVGFGETNIHAETAILTGSRHAACPAFEGRHRAGGPGGSRLRSVRTLAGGCRVVTERAAPEVKTLTIRLAMRCLRRAGTPPLTSRWRRPGGCASIDGSSTLGRTAADLASCSYPPKRRFRVRRCCWRIELVGVQLPGRSSMRYPSSST
jgi:hypothetical protein